MLTVCMAGCTAVVVHAYIDYHCRHLFFSLLFDFITIIIIVVAVIVISITTI